MDGKALRYALDGASSKSVEVARLRARDKSKWRKSVKLCLHSPKTDMTMPSKRRPQSELHDVVCQPRYN